MQQRQVAIELGLGHSRNVSLIYAISSTCFKILAANPPHCCIRFDAIFSRTISHKCQNKKQLIDSMKTHEELPATDFPLTSWRSTPLSSPGTCSPQIQNDSLHTQRHKNGSLRKWLIQYIFTQCRCPVCTLPDSAIDSRSSSFRSSRSSITPSSPWTHTHNLFHANECGLEITLGQSKILISDHLSFLGTVICGKIREFILTHGLKVVYTYVLVLVALYRAIGCLVLLPQNAHIVLNIPGPCRNAMILHTLIQLVAEGHEEACITISPGFKWAS